MCRNCEFTKSIMANGGKLIGESVISGKELIIDFTGLDPSDGLCLESPEGSNVVFLGRNGGEYDLRYHQQHLTTGRVYTLDYLDIGSSHTYVFLKELPGKPFNSVCFSNVPIAQP